jgi:DNA processing protein
MNNVKTKHIIAFSLLSGVGSAFIKKNLTLIKTKIESPIDLCSLNHKIDISDFEQNLIVANRTIEDCAKLDIQIITILDDEYPNSLMEIKDPPPILYLKGNKTLLNKAVAIIGTRKSTELGNKIAAKVGLYFSHKWSICNGLVDGIDRHSILIENKVLPNIIGVLSGGLNYEYTCPKMTKELATQVLENNGLLLSEYEPNKKEDQFSGSKASRIQAGLSNALILIQSSKDGGSKYTIKAFSVLERPLAIIDFKNNIEFNQTANFEANRLIIEKGKKGIMEMCDIKKIESILITKIISIEKSEDYQLVENTITAANNKMPGKSGRLFH